MRELPALLSVAFVWAFVVSAIALAQSPNRAADEAGVRQAGKDYLAALEQGEAKAIAEFWTADGTYTDEHDQIFKARDLIQKSFTGGKSARPHPQISNVSIRFPTGDVAVEEGACETTALGTALPQSGRFAALWVKQNGKWKLDSLRESHSGVVPATFPHATNDLASLELLIGQWTGASDKLSMQCSAKWNSGKTFIRRELSISDGRNELFGGTQEIGWDPASQSIKSWTFNNDGSHSEGAWNIEGNSWIVVTSGETADGRPSSNTQICKFPDKNTLVWRLIDGRAGDQSMPTMEFKLTRKAAPK